MLPDAELDLRWKNHPVLRKIAPVILDFVPGLGHLAIGRLKQIWWLLPIWALLVASAIYFLPRPLGFLLIGLAVGVHVFILMRHSIIKDTNSFQSRIIIAFGFLIMLLFTYRFVPLICLPWLTGGYITFDIPADNIETNDFFLADRNFDTLSLQRGSLVLLQPHGAPHRQRVCGQIIALPGEHIENKDDCFVVNRQILDNQKYPVPEWLRIQRISLNIDNDSYFISLEYNTYRQVNDNLLRQACVYGTNDIYGRAFMRWLPISKRGFVR